MAPAAGGSEAASLTAPVASMASSEAAPPPAPTSAGWEGPSMASPKCALPSAHHNDVSSTAVSRHARLTELSAA